MCFKIISIKAARSVSSQFPRGVGGVGVGAGITGEEEQPQSVINQNIFLLYSLAWDISVPGKRSF